MKREQIPSMSALPLPFALNGETSIPVKELDPFLDDGNLGSLGFDGKYQWNGSTPPSRFITRQLMNRLLGQISGRQFLKQCGALDTFDQNVCDAIGGYPQWAVLQYLDGDILYDVVSLIDNNEVDYTKVGIDNVSWRIYGSSIFSYMFPDYGSVGTNNILKTFNIYRLGWTFNWFGSSLGEQVYVSEMKYISYETGWSVKLKYIETEQEYGTFNKANEYPYATRVQFDINGTPLVAGRNSQTTSSELTIISPCWIQAFIDNLDIISGMSNYECGIIIYGSDTSKPYNEPVLSNTLYTTYELAEGGTIATPILPVLPGNKICAFATMQGKVASNIIIRKLTPVRTR